MMLTGACRFRYLGQKPADAAGTGTGVTSASAAPKKPTKNSEKFAKIFKMDWDTSEDTSADINPLYSSKSAVALGFGRGHQAGIDERAQRKGQDAFLEALLAKRQAEAAELARAAAEAAASASALFVRRGGGGGGDSSTRAAAAGLSASAAGAVVGDGEHEPAILAGTLLLRPAGGASSSSSSSASSSAAGGAGTGSSTHRGMSAAARVESAEHVHWSDKPLAAMTERDWRIMREDFDIHVKGGKPLHPLRKWDECAIHPDIRRAIDEAGE